MSTMHVWAAAWLEQVAEAAKALERDRLARAARREAVLKLGSPLAGGPHGKGGASDPMAAVDAMVDAEGADGLAWARDEMDRFYACMGAVRAGCEGEIAEATVVAELRYALGMSASRTARELGCSRATVYRRIDVLVDYLDYVGPEIAKNETV